MNTESRRARPVACRRSFLARCGSGLWLCVALFALFHPPTSDADTASILPIPVHVPTAKSQIGSCTQHDRADALICGQSEQLADATQHPDLSAQIQEDLASFETLSATVRYDDPKLINPLVKLGDLHSQSGIHEKTIQFLDRAIHLLRMNHGLHNPMQLPLVDRQIESLLALRKVQDAEQRQLYAYFLIQMQHKENPAEAVASEYRMAEWYLSIGMPLMSRRYYAKIIRMLEQSQGRLHPALIAPLQGISTSYRHESFPGNLVEDVGPFPDVHPRKSTESSRDRRSIHPTSRLLSVRGNNPQSHHSHQGEQALKRVIEIYENNPRLGTPKLAQAHTSLADWYSLFKKTNRANAHYKIAIALLSQAAEHSQILDQQFGAPKPLYIPPLSAPGYSARAAPVKLEKGFIHVEYTVDVKGCVRNVKVIAADPPNLLSYKTKKALRQARYRPRFDGDIPVATTLRYQHHYQYHPSSLDGRKI